MLAKTIVITGAGVGLGRALARRFAGDGDNVVLLGRTPAKVEAVAAELGERALAVTCDVASADSVRAAFATIAERHPTFDVLINNAAVFEPFLIADGTDAQIAGAIGTNLTGAIFCARTAIPMLGRGGLIVNVSSESVTVPLAHLLVYQASKAGLERFSTGLDQELEPDGIRVCFVRAGQMMEEGKTWDVDPAAQRRFAEANAARGLNLRTRPISQFTSVTDAFRLLVDLPPDLHVDGISLSARSR